MPTRARLFQNTHTDRYGEGRRGSTIATGRRSLGSSSRVGGISDLKKRASALTMVRHQRYTSPAMSSLSDITQRDWDFVIVGTGIGGGTLGPALARAGRQVLFIEKG